MNKVLPLFAIFLFSNYIFAQTTAIPSAIFEQELINLGYDTILDGQVTTANIARVQTLNLFNKGVGDLTGIQDFTSLDSLYCQGNWLTSLDVSSNLSLELLWCGSNQITTLDLSQNTNLINIDCQLNQITTLNVNGLTSLIYLICVNNPLSSLDLSSNTAIRSLSAGYNLNCLNYQNGNNINYSNFYTQNNPDLTCIQVDNPSWSTSTWTNVDPQVYFSSNCPSSCAVGIDELSATFINIYPNPTSSNIIIDLGEVKQDLKATLTNSLGQVLLTKNYTSTNYINLDLDCPKGIYFLRIETDKETITKKFVKQ